jgi:hypothetical protein
MSTMNDIDLQCQEAQEIFTAFLDTNEDVPVDVALAVLQRLVYNLTPIEAWEITLPHLMRWAWEEFAFEIPRERLH